jgi:hypothetical protein
MSLSTTAGLARGTKVTFRTKSPIDQTKYIGRILGIDLDYSLATGYTSIDEYHANVLRSDPILSGVKNLSYFVIGIESQATGDVVEHRSFANEWIEPGSLEVITDKKSWLISVWSMPTEDPVEIIRTLAAAGYASVLVRENV